jgi:hypothetical protein
MEIDRGAPAVARAEIEVTAPADVVWRVLTDMGSWPGWSSAVRSASLEGPLEPGTQFRWKAGRAAIVSTLQSVEPPSRIVWTGRTFGVEAIHVHTFEQHDRVTTVTSEESWNGLLVRLLRRRMTTMLQSSLEAGLRDLKAEAERAAGRAAAP